MELSAQLPADPVAQAIKEGRLASALDLLQNQIRAAGADARLRMSLFQLLCVIGQWDRARTQLQTLDSFGEEYKTWTRMMGQALLAEALRREVFAGETTPTVLGEPLPWIAPLLQALRPGDAAARARLRAEAFEAATAVPARVNGFEIPWLADADSRLGPVLEAHMEGKYYWIPFERIRRLSLEPPTDLRHLVWVPAQITFVTGGESAALIPTRYAGTEQGTDDRLRLARRTEWDDLGEGQFRGLGQRTFTAGDTDYPLLEIRTLEFTVA